MKLKFNKIKLSTDMSVCIVDNIGGCYTNIAKEMTNYFGKVYYHPVNQNPFPMLSMDLVGSGYDNIEKVDDFWSLIDKFDVIIFPDIYFSDWGNHLRKMGKLVWGGTPAEILETDRHLFKDELISVGLPIVPTEYVIGLSNLINYLKEKQNKWVKISYYRGNMETYHHINMNQSAIWLNNLKSTMGPASETIEFLIEDNVDCIAEVGYDGWSVNGKLPNSQIWGIETKDCSYIGTHIEKSGMPEPVTYVNDKFEPILTKYNHTGFYSNEIRVGQDGKYYYVDAAMRAGSPPSATYLKLINNWDEIIIGGCKGEIVEPTYAAKYGCELILKSSFCFKNFMPIEITKEYTNNINLRGNFYYNNSNYIVPFDQGGLFDMDAFGSVVVIGDDVDTILTKAVEIADSLNAYGLSYDKDALNRTKQSIQDITTTLNLKFNN